jgi:hypothetical protein
MIQTRKTYKKMNGEFVENANGFIIGYEFTDSSNITRRCLYTESHDDLVNETISATARYEWLDPIKNKWVLVEIETSLATMDSFVDANGVLDESPFENDLTKPITQGDDLTKPLYMDIEGVNTLVGYEALIIGYQQKLKTGLYPEFAVVYGLQLTLFNPIIQSIQARKYGATGFD